ncbi:MAG TPA: hypothetical protein VFU81_14095, partial [Thermomicrobiales bacterium]|nr:hypothetical protein [Thermomicrobiales bacterium]
MTSIARTSFSPSIASPTDENAKRDAFLAWVSGAAPPGIACVATRAHAAGIAAALAGESPFAVGDSAVHVRRGAGTVVGQGDGAV